MTTIKELKNHKELGYEDAYIIAKRLVELGVTAPHGDYNGVETMLEVEEKLMEKGWHEGAAISIAYAVTNILFPAED